jgi:hypothetical protein
MKTVQHYSLKFNLVNNQVPNFKFPTSNFHPPLKSPETHTHTDHLRGQS